MQITPGHARGFAHDCLVRLQAQPRLFELDAQYPPPSLGIRRPELDRFGEARHDRGVEQVPTVGRANDEDLPGGLVESVPLGQEGLHQLGTELVACDAAAGAEYALALVDEQQSRCVLAATLPDFLDPRAGAADVLAFQVGNTYRYEIASLLLRQLARDQCLARARRPEQQHALWGWLATRLEEIHQFEDSVKGLARQ